MFIPIPRWVIYGVAAAVVGSLTGWIAAKVQFFDGLASIKAGEWAQAVSGMTGVIVTILATRWLERRKEVAAKASEKALLLSTLYHTRHVCELVAGDNPTFNALSIRDQAAAGYELLRNNFELTEYALTGYRISSFNLWQSIKVIRDEHGLRREELIREERLVRDLRSSDQVIAISARKLREFCESIHPAVRMAIDELTSGT